MYTLIAPAIRPLHTHRVLRSCTRHFSACPACPAASPLFHLQAFSNSRESRWLAKGSGLSPIEHSTQLQLIRSSEGLDPKGQKTQAQKKQRALRGAVSNDQIVPPVAKALGSVSGEIPKSIKYKSGNKIAESIGQAILARHAAQRITFKRKMARLERRNKTLSRREEQKTIFVVLSVALVTACAVWMYDRDKRIRARERSLTECYSEYFSRIAARMEDETRASHAPVLSENSEIVPKTLLAQQASEEIEVQRVSEALSASTDHWRPWWRRLFWS